MTDSELLKDYIGKRDENAFAEIVLRYERLVWSVCHRLLNNHSDREDAFQETFLVLARSAHRIRKPDSMSNWLYGVTWKTASRIRKRRAMLSLNEYIECGNEIADSGESQLDRITRLNEFELVNRHLQSMSERHRTPLILFYFSGFTAKQIANQLNLTLAATEGRLRRSREQLRRLSYGTPDANGDFQEGAFAPQGSMSLLLTVAIGFQSCPELLASTVQNSIAATASVSTGVTSGILSLGAKTMICKFACAAGISAILAFGGMLHMGAPQEDGTKHAAKVVVQPAESDGELVAEFALSGATTADSQCCPCCDCCDETACSIYDTIHTHVGSVHKSLAESVHNSLAIRFRIARLLRTGH